MSLSSLKGAIGVGFQSAKGAFASSYEYIPVLQADVQGEQMAQNLPPEVGGQLFARGSYKAGVRSKGQVTMLPRPNTVGYFLASIFNSEVVASAGGDLYDHTFTVSDVAATPPQWLCLRRMIGALWGEQMRDARVGTFRIEAAAANVAQAQVQLVGGLYEEIPTADVAASDDFVFLTCDADVTEGGVPFIVDRVSMDIGAQLTDNEFRVGSYFLDDITMLQRSAAFQADVRVKGREQWAKLYRNNGAQPTGGNVGAWSPVIYRSAVSLELRTAEVAPQFLRFTFPGVDFLTLPVALSGAELVRAQLTASVTLAADNFNPDNPVDATKQPITVVLRNKRATKYAVN
jgi:hypothetical protein